MSGRSVTDVADGVFAVVNADGSHGLANSCVLLDGRTATVVDTMLTPAMAQAVKDAVRHRGAEATQVLNTHNHMDHLGGNAAFPEAHIAAHPTTAWIIGRMAEEHDWLPGLFPPYADELADLEFRSPTAVPDELELPAGARLLVHEKAHSPVDLAVWLPGQRVLVSGDLCVNGVVPLARHGSLTRWAEALDALLALGPRVVVPGHGAPTGAATLQAVRDYLRAVLAAGAELLAAGESRDGHDEARDPQGEARDAVDEALAGVDLGPVGDWREPGRHRINLEVAMAELSGTPLPVGPPR